MKIAVTSQNFKTITGHAGKTRRFIIFSKNSQGEWLETERLDLPKDMSFHEFNGAEHPVDHVDVMITSGCGQGFIRKMQSRGIEVIISNESVPLNAVTQFIKNR